MDKSTQAYDTTSYSLEDAIKIASAVNVVRKYDEMLMKLSQFKEKLAREILSKPMRSGALKKMFQEEHAAKTISKGWRKRETEVASEGLHKLSEALEKVALSRELLTHAAGVAKKKQGIANQKLLKSLTKKQNKVWYDKLYTDTISQEHAEYLKKNTLRDLQKNKLLTKRQQPLDKEQRLRGAQAKFFAAEAPNRKSNPDFRNLIKTKKPQPAEELSAIHAEKTSSIDILKVAMSSRTNSPGVTALQSALTKNAAVADEVLRNVLLAGAGAGVGSLVGGEEGKDPENLGKTINRETGALRGVATGLGVGIGGAAGRALGSLSSKPMSSGAAALLMALGGGVAGHQLAEHYGPQYEWEKKKERIEGE